MQTKQDSRKSRQVKSIPVTWGSIQDSVQICFFFSFQDNPGSISQPDDALVKLREINFMS